MPILHIVLLEPEIPQNTGNIARTCAALGAHLHLIKPLGFSLADRYMKRAGLDYWEALSLHVYEDMADFGSKNPHACLYYFSKKARHGYTDVAYPPEVYFMFGKESVGLPETLLKQHEPACLRLPMKEGLRSLNLSNAVAIAAYEFMRQQGFAGLQGEGEYNEK